MTWVRIDDQWPDHPKARSAGRDGRSLFIVGLCHCAQYETDGFISHDTIPLLLAKAEVTRAAVKRLVAIPKGFDHGSWEEVDGGYFVHDFLIYHPSHAKLEAEREDGARRQRESRENRKRSAGLTGTSRRDTSVSDTDASRDPVPIPIPSSKKRLALKPEPPDFVAFYERYPRREARPDALRAWSKATSPPSAATATEVSIGLDRWIEYWHATGTDQQFICQPARFLNSRKWEDQPSSVVALPTTRPKQPEWMLGPNGSDEHYAEQ